MSNAVLEARQDVIPQTLAQVITRQRDLCTLRLSSDDELAGLQKAIVADELDATHVITNWRVVCIDRAPENGGQCHILLGDIAHTGTPCSSSPLVFIDLGWRWAVSASGSLYRLRGQRTRSEPPPRHVLQMCQALCRWRVGKFLGAFDSMRQRVRHGLQDEQQH